MRHHAMLAIALLTAVIPAASGSLDRAPLTVHEWGTFTSVAGPDGTAVDWIPQAGPSDLPCFVDRNRFNIKGRLSGTVRMETPVLYFYAPRETTVDVAVQFRQGVMTEWFPRALATTSALEWRRVKVSPEAAADFPTGKEASHYYAARRTEAAPLMVGSDTEKFLFYRGVGRFQPRIPADSVRFSNDDGFSQPPTSEIERQLVAHGLFPAEAKAMIDTWRDSWFEEGTRVFYIVPRHEVDDILPLHITPEPAALVRVFVGRMELVTPARLTKMKAALLANDVATLRRHRRFLQPIGRRLLTESRGVERARLERRLQDLSSLWTTPEDACYTETP
jgi:hypothetical protein